MKKQTKNVQKTESGRCCTNEKQQNERACGSSQPKNGK